jgi:hypothetical protein
MFDEATATARLDLTDPSKIALLQPALDAAQAIAERYCDRLFDEADETEEIIPVHLGAVQVKRYPIATVASITGAHSGVIGEKHIDKQAGVIYLDGGAASHEVSVTYHGGYRALPPDLELALWMIFDGIWPQFNLPVTGGAATAPGTMGAISSISIPDVGRISFDTGNSSSSGAGTSGGAFGFIPATAVSLLEPYRRKSC